MAQLYSMGRRRLQWGTSWRYCGTRAGDVRGGVARPVASHPGRLRARTSPMPSLFVAFAPGPDLRKRRGRQVASASRLLALSLLAAHQASPPTALQQAFVPDWAAMGDLAPTSRQRRRSALVFDSTFAIRNTSSRDLWLNPNHHADKNGILCTGPAKSARAISFIVAVAKCKNVPRLAHHNRPPALGITDQPSELSEEKPY